VRSFRHRRNLGKAAALSNGFARSEGRIVVMMDADGQDDPAEIPRLVSALNEDVGLVEAAPASQRSLHQADDVSPL